jgi:hypothetical protein
VVLHDLERGWRTWTIGESIGWQALPFEGGFLDQPEALMDDVVTIAALSRRAKSMVKGG